MPISEVTEVERAKVLSYAATPDAITTAMVERFRAFQSDPVRYCKVIHGRKPETLWDKQKEVLRSVVENKYTAVPSGHSLGKSFLASLAAWHWKICFRPSKVIITAPGSRQAGLIVGNEIRSRYRELVDIWSREELHTMGFGDGPNTEGFSQDPDNFMAWFATNPDEAQEHATRMAGFHSPHLLFIFDEAGGIDKIIWESIQGSLLGAHRHFLAIGNPTDSTSQFARFCRQPKVNVIRLDGEEFPNVIENREVLPYGPTRENIEELKAYWGADSATYQWKVRGLFPTTAINTLISADEMTKALARKSAKPGCEHAPEKVGLGCDVARFGDDRTLVFAACRGCGRILKNEQRSGQDLMATVGMVTSLAKSLGMNEDHGRQIAIDDTGVGGGVTDRLRELGWYTNAVNFGSKPVTATREADFINRRTELWWKMRDWIRAKAALAEELDPRLRDILRDELTAVQYDYRGSEQKVLLEPKADLKKRIGKSPDAADALALALVWGAGSADVQEKGDGASMKKTKDDQEDDDADEAESDRGQHGQRARLFSAIYGASATL